jgi:alanyl-tRNA synthetase
VNATGKIGYFRFVNETSVAAGIRRVEAVTGKSAVQHDSGMKKITGWVRSVLGNQKDPLESLSELIEKNKALEKELQKIQQEQAAGQLRQYPEQRNGCFRCPLYTGKVDGGEMDSLKQMGYDALQKVKETVSLFWLLLMRIRAKCT